MREKIEASVRDSILQKERVLTDGQGVTFIETVSKTIIECIRRGGKLLICGNGGSAADSQHFAAELVGRFMIDRRALPAIALTTDTSILTAVGNDYGYDDVFVRQIDAICNPGDVVVGISTSGNSVNVVKAVARAKEMGAVTVCLLGNKGGYLKSAAKFAYVVNSTESARIQEVHIMIEHIICQIVESELFKK